MKKRQRKFIRSTIIAADLIIEDNPICWRFSVICGKPLGQCTLAAADGQTGNRKAKGNEARRESSVYRTPGIDGYEVAERICATRI